MQSEALSLQASAHTGVAIRFLFVGDGEAETFRPHRRGDSRIARGSVTPGGPFMNGPYGGGGSFEWRVLSFEETRGFRSTP